MGKSFRQLFASIILIFFTWNSVFAWNIDSNDKWAWWSQMGWINFWTSTWNVDVTSSSITWYAWSTMYGWINLAPTMAWVTNTCDGELAWYAWSGMFGYISFSGATIDGNGYFQWQATTPSNGNIVFRGTNFRLKTSWVPTCDSTSLLHISAPLTGALLTDNTPTVSWTWATPGSQVIITWPNLQTCTAIAGGGGNWTCDISPLLAEWINKISATEVLSNGNALPSKVISVIVDSQSPLAPTIIDVDWDTSSLYYTNDTTPSVTGTGEINSVITLTTSTGVLLWTGLVDGSGNWTISPSKTLPEWSNQLNVTSTDITWNVSPITQVDIIIDTILPNTPTIANPTNGLLTNDNTPIINGTGEPWTAFVIKDATWSIIWTWIVDGGGNYSFTPTISLPDGSNTLNVTLVDASWNESTAATTIFTVDTLAPTPLTIITPINTSVTNDNTPILTGSWEANTIFEVRDGSANFLWTGTVDVSGNYIFTPISALPEWLNTYSVTLSDGVNTTWPITSTFTIDTVAPWVPVLQTVWWDSTSPYATNDSTPTIVWIWEVWAVVSIISSTWVVLWTGTVDGSGSWSIIPTNPLAEWINNLTIQQIDVAWNISLGVPFSVNIDSIAPLTPTIVSAGWDIISPYGTNDSIPTLTGTGTSWDIITIKNSIGTVLWTGIIDWSGNWSVDLNPALPDGTHILDITETDSFGNISPVRTINLAVDTVAPNVPVVTSAGWDTTAPYVSNDNTPAILWTGEVWAVVSILSSTWMILWTWTVQSDGSWNISPISALPEWTNNLIVHQTDVAGNTSSDVPVSIDIDSIAPVAPTVLTIWWDSMSPYATNDTTPTITGTWVTWDIISVLDSTGTLLWTGMVDGSGNWSIITSPAFTDGTYVLSITETDSFGNVSPSNSANIVIDTITPLSPVLSTVWWDSTSPYITNDTTPLITWTGEINSVIILTTSTGIVLWTGLVDGSGNWSIILANPLSEWIQTLSATSKDAAWNTSSITNIPFTVNISIPSTPTITAVTNDTLSPYITNDSTPTITGTGTPNTQFIIKNTSWVVLWTGLIDGSGNFTFTLSSSLSDWIHNLIIISKNEAGSVSGTTALPITIDTIAPVIPSLLTPSSSNGEAVSSFPTVSWIWEVGAIITVTSWTWLILGITVVDGNGTWSLIPSTSLPIWLNSLLAYQTDAAWNISPITSRYFEVSNISNWSSSSGWGGGWAWNGNTKISDKWTFSTNLAILAPNNITSSPTQSQNDSQSDKNSSTNTSWSNSNNSDSSNQPNNSERPMTKTIDGLKKSYILKNDFRSCQVIDNLNDTSYLPDYPTKFKDLSQTSFVDDIIQMEKVWIIDGNSETLFQPTRSITRAEFLKILLKSHCYEYQNQDTSFVEFTDLEKDSWQSKVTKKAFSLGIIDGDIDNNWKKIFRPNDRVSKAEAIKMLINMWLLQIGEAYKTSYSDVYKTWYEKYVADGEYLGIVNAENDSYVYNPDSFTVRDEMIHMTMKLLRLYR
jgi:Bacterial Ig-like domain/Bacterial Ig domain/S-layer homology domain